MKNAVRISRVILLILSIFLIQSCIKEKPTPPVISTTTITAISYTTATSGGDVTNEGGAPVTTRGVCWNTSLDPTTTNNKTTDGTGIGSFNSSLTGLIAGTTYYIRAYATNTAGSGYGNQVTFTTLQVAAPVLTTTAITSITQTTAVSGGNITADNGSSVTARGVCWNTSANPTIALSTKTTDGTGTGSFSSNLTGLQPGTIYYVRSYATNSVGTSYGNEVSFTTLATVPTLTTTAATSITGTSATSGGNISADGGAAVTARGVCWATTSTPTTANSKTTDGTGTGIFTSSLTNLSPNTTYYVRAYATNSVGTAYGTQVSFTTSAVAPVIPTLTTTAASSITSTTATSGGTITSDGGASVTARGVCWNTSANPTIALSTKTTDGTGTGAFTSSITALTANTTYYVRAYATNSVGTAYGTQVSFTTSSGGQTGTVTDIDGNIYNTVTIGTQVWMKEDLKVTHYRNGNPIPKVTDNTIWGNLTTGAYCWYNNDSATYENPYGKLYNWYTVNTGIVCPIGWHIPSDTEWTTLTTYLGGESLAGGKLKETGIVHWSNPNIGATNTSGFSGLGGGDRYSNGGFYYVGTSGDYWSSTEYSSTEAYDRFLYNLDTFVYREHYDKVLGFYIRCVMN